MPSPEQGGVSQRSSLPQQVVPFGRVLPFMTAPGTENCFFSFFEPQ